MLPNATDVYATAVHEPDLTANNRFEAVGRCEEVAPQLREPPQGGLPADRAVGGIGRDRADDLDEAIANPPAAPRVCAVRARTKCHPPCWSRTSRSSPGWTVPNTTLSPRGFSSTTAMPMTRTLVTVCASAGRVSRFIMTTVDATVTPIWQNRRVVMVWLRSRWWNAVFLRGRAVDPTLWLPHEGTRRLYHPTPDPPSL